MGASRDEEQATQEVADYLRRQDWTPADPYKDGNEKTRDEQTNGWWLTRAEDVLDAVAEAGAKLYGGDLSLDDDETAILKARIDAAISVATARLDVNWHSDETERELLVEEVLDAVKGFINGQVV